MNKRRKNFNQRRELTNNKVIRCKLHMRPVLEQNTCSDFKKGNNNEARKCCKNCKESF